LLNEGLATSGTPYDHGYFDVVNNPSLLAIFTPHSGTVQHLDYDSNLSTGGITLGFQAQYPDGISYQEDNAELSSYVFRIKDSSNFVVFDSSSPATTYATCNNGICFDIPTATPLAFNTSLGIWKVVFEAKTGVAIQPGYYFEVEKNNATGYGDQMSLQQFTSQTFSVIGARLAVTYTALLDINGNPKTNFVVGDEGKIQFKVQYPNGQYLADQISDLTNAVKFYPVEASKNSIDVTGSVFTRGVLSLGSDSQTWTMPFTVAVAGPSKVGYNIRLFGSISGDSMRAPEENSGDANQLAEAGIVTIPTGNILHQNYPNPFNPERNTTTLRFDLLDASVKPQVKIFTPSGILVKQFNEADVISGNKVIWDGKNNSGSTVANGIYIALLNINGKTSSVKIIVEKK